MPMQYPYGSPNDKYKLKLFVDTGFNFVEVEARIIEPYTPPTPQPNMKEIKIVNAPSHFHQMGVSSYKCTLNLLFKDKRSYHNYLMWVGWTHKFYDEQGHIYLGAVESIKPATAEASSKYKVEVNLILIKKDALDAPNRFQYQDIQGHWAQKYIEDMANSGIVAVITADNQPVLYFRPNDFCTRAEFITMLNRTRRLLEHVIGE